MQCPQCNSPLDDDTIFCGNCGRQIAPLQARGATISVEEARQINDGQFPRNTSYGAQGPVSTTPDTPGSPGSDSVTLLSPSRSPRNSVGRIALIIALILLLVAGATLGVSLLRGGSVPASNATGQVRFLDGPNSQGNTDALQVTINGLTPPPSGSQYDAGPGRATCRVAKAGTIVKRSGADPAKCRDQPQHIGHSMCSPEYDRHHRGQAWRTLPTALRALCPAKCQECR